MIFEPSNKTNLNENSNSLIDGYTFKLCKGNIECFNITKGTTKEEYIKLSNQEYGSDATIVIKGPESEILGHNVVGMTPKIKRYFSQRNIHFNTKIELDERKQANDKILEEWYNPDNLLDFDSYIKETYKDKNIFVFILYEDKEGLEALLDECKCFDSNSEDYYKYKSDYENENKEHSIVYGIMNESDFEIEPRLYKRELENDYIKELIKKSLLKEYNYYVKVNTL